jgi:hypothetical protein
MHGRSAMMGFVSCGWCFMLYFIYFSYLLDTHVLREAKLLVFVSDGRIIGLGTRKCAIEREAILIPYPRVGPMHLSFLQPKLSLSMLIKTFMETKRKANLNAFFL